MNEPLDLFQGLVPSSLKALYKPLLFPEVYIYPGRRQGLYSVFKGPIFWTFFFLLRNHKLKPVYTALLCLLRY